MKRKTDRFPMLFFCVECRSYLSHVNDSAGKVSANDTFCILLLEGVNFCCSSEPSCDDIEQH